MTDKENKSIALTLAAATGALLGSVTNSPVNAQEEPGWDFNSALLYYGESDGRVQDTSLSLLARRMFEDDKSLTMMLTIENLNSAYSEHCY